MNNHDTSVSIPAYKEGEVYAINQCVSSCGRAFVSLIPSNTDAIDVAGSWAGPFDLCELINYFATGTVVNSAPVITLLGDNPLSLLLEEDVNTPPVVTLQGGDPITVVQGGTFFDPGATAVDAEDGIVSVSVGGDLVTTSVIGTYTVTYSATDSGGLTTMVSRTVNVVAPAANTPPVISLLGLNPATHPAPTQLLLLNQDAFAEPLTDNWTSVQGTSETNLVGGDVLELKNDTGSSASVVSNDLLDNTPSNTIEFVINEISTSASIVSVKLIVGQNPSVSTDRNVSVSRDNSTGICTISNGGVTGTGSGRTVGVLQFPLTVRLVNDNGDQTVQYKQPLSTGFTTLTDNLGAPIVVSANVGSPEFITLSSNTNSGNLFSPTIIESIALVQGNMVRRPYDDGGATATDAEDGNLTGSIVVTNNVDVNVPGTYTVDYSVTDSGGLTDTAQRTVTVLGTVI